eukprot:6758079-Lingulodinium_polyedra.AAC.1
MPALGARGPFDPSERAKANAAAVGGMRSPASALRMLAGAHRQIGGRLHRALLDVVRGEPGAL